MPFFDTQTPRNSRKEKQFLADIYGTKDNMNTQLSTDEVEKMRELVLAHDKQAAQSTVIDMGKPIIVPYAYRQFPQMVYDHNASEPGYWAIRKTQNGDELYHVTAKLVNKIVTSHAELEAAKEQGFVEAPPVLEDCNTQETPHTGLGRPERKRKRA